MNVQTLALSCLLCLPAFAADLPPQLLPEGAGVNIHFTRGNQRDLDLIAAAGFKFIRMDFSWGGTERQPGQYNWSDYDELTANLELRGIRPLYIFDYSNRLYEETVTSKNPLTGQERQDPASPRHPESVAAFARWAAAAAQHFQGRRVIWEIWNEPNISFWKPTPDVQRYTALALATGKAVRAADPQATIIAPASAAFPWEFLESFLQSGVLEYLDAVSVHPYRSPRKSPETAADDFRRLRGLIEQHAPTPAKRSLPIISGEWGYSTFTKGVTLEMQAMFIVRQQLFNLLQGVPLSIWYDWKNDGTDPNENEHNFGTVTPDLKPKPAYIAMQTLTHELAGYRIARRVQAGSDTNYVLLLSNDAREQKLAAWTLGDTATVELQVSSTAGELPAVNGNGQTLTLKISSGRLSIDLTGLPKYVALGQAKLADR